MKEITAPLLAGLIAGFILGWYVTKPVKIIETKAPEARLADGSLALGRDPKAKAPGAKSIPKGTKIERKVQVTVKPNQEGCPACVVDLSLVREKNGMHRVIASSPTGEIVSGIDVPIGSTLIDRKKLWAAGVSYGEGFGGWIERDLGPFRAGLDVDQKDGGLTGRLRIGIVF